MELDGERTGCLLAAQIKNKRAEDEKYIRLVLWCNG